MCNKEEDDTVTSTISKRFVISEQEANEIASLKPRVVKQMDAVNDLFLSKEQRAVNAKKMIAARKGLRNGN
ncbi:hypothetical protein [Peribacillus sp. NPDC097295]|uniref:hypothetical protein n=1 Tax=Peribacillus sp. NPDC097295 TaxID=3364402 RepID=UPI0038307B1D